MVLKTFSQGCGVRASLMLFLQLIFLKIRQHLPQVLRTLIWCSIWFFDQIKIEINEMSEINEPEVTG